MKKTRQESSCPMDALLRLLMGPWTTYILWVLRNQGPLRFGALQRAVGKISARVLTERLRLLEEAGIIYRDYRPTVPPEVSYGLTERGQELGNVLDGLDQLARRWAGIDASTETLPLRSPPGHSPHS
ncbi:winged helix-turn-helix transcriptional regulator [Acidithiobacillus sulfuriphilus]|uniref:winged helix-turn-helix transcriptional regulator n=1 Tax=Acidithiobacillus sulfuriphilus TaxID=1867749 RepID=UPI003F61F43B